ncbi:unnamed protein product, partial [Amoebophrya sp. A120]|eukprot:GSA120T00000832001.1
MVKLVKKMKQRTTAAGTGGKRKKVMKKIKGKRKQEPLQALTDETRTNSVEGKPADGGASDAEAENDETSIGNDSEDAASQEDERTRVELKQLEPENENDISDGQQEEKNEQHVRENDEDSTLKEQVKTNDNALALQKYDAEKIQRFTDFSFLPAWAADGLTHMNLFYPTTIQKLALPLCVERKNVIGNAKTGTGKTLCYALPTLLQLSKDPFGVFALVLSPVRELCFQIADVFEALGKPVRASCL